MESTTRTAQDICRRCQGKGRGDWAPEMGICHLCRGTGKASTGRALKARAALEARIQSEIEDAYVTIPAADRAAASHALCMAFDMLVSRTQVVEIVPGWFAATIALHPDWRP